MKFKRNHRAQKYQFYILNRFIFYFHLASPYQGSSVKCTAAQLEIFRFGVDVILPTLQQLIVLLLFYIFWIMPNHFEGSFGLRHYKHNLGNWINQHGIYRSFSFFFLIKVEIYG